MIKRKILISLLSFSCIVSAVYSFSIDEINQSIDPNYDIDLQWDKVDYKFSKQDQIKKDNNGWYVNTSRDSYIDSSDNLNLDNIQDPDVEDNSQQWESKEEFNGSVIPINYYEKRLTDIKDNIIRKKKSFEMEYYEEWAVKIKSNLQRYYNPDLSSVLVWGVPSTFGFWKDSVVATSPGDDLWLDGWNNWADLPTVDCSKTCDCGQWYYQLRQCKRIPPNSYSIKYDFKCFRGYEKDETWTKCIVIEEEEVVPITDSPFEWIRYKWVQPIDEDDDPFGISVKPWQSSQYSTSNLWIYNWTYSSIDSNFISDFDPNNYNSTINNGSYTNCAQQSFANPTNYYSYYNFACPIKKQSSIYDVPMTPAE